MFQFSSSVFSLHKIMTHDFPVDNLMPPTALKRILGVSQLLFPERSYVEASSCLDSEVERMLLLQKKCFRVLSGNGRWEPPPAPSPNSSGVGEVDVIQTEVICNDIRSGEALRWNWNSFLCSTLFAKIFCFYVVLD